MSAFTEIATKGRLTLGLVFPLEAYSGSIPNMKSQEQLAKRAEELGFKALWVRETRAYQYCGAQSSVRIRVASKSIHCLI